MPKYVIVNEYEPSSATLKLGGKTAPSDDPIYRQSSGQENLAIGTQVMNPLIILGIMGVGGLVIYLLGRGEDEE